MTTRSVRMPRGTAIPEDLGRALGKWQSAVVRLGEVDAITTEMVRLRCARHHDCHT